MRISVSRSRLSALASAGLLCGCVGTSRGPDHARPAGSLAFLAGHWRHTDDGAHMEEFWFPPVRSEGVASGPGADATTGVLRWHAPDGRLLMHELLSLSPDPDAPGLYRYAMRHFDPAMQPWASEAEGPLTGTASITAPGTLTIRCQQRNGSVESITYVRTDDAMVCTLRFDSASGREPIVIDFVLVD